jgi:hypothetical protein
VRFTHNTSLDGCLEYYLNPQVSAPPQQSPDNFVQAPWRGTPRGIAGLVDASGRAILPSFEYAVGEIISAERLKEGEAVKVNGRSSRFSARPPVLKTD